MPSSKQRKAEQDRARRAGSKAATADSVGHPRPEGRKRAPKGCYWDGHTEPAGVWRRCGTNEVFDPAAVRRVRNAGHRRTTDEGRARHAEQQRRTAQRAQQRSRRGKHLRARCNETLLKRSRTTSRRSATSSSTACTARQASTSGCASSPAKRASPRSRRPRLKCSPCTAGSVRRPKPTPQTDRLGQRRRVNLRLSLARTYALASRVCVERG